MTRRIFAVIRSAIVAPAFVSLWTWFIPRWIAGDRAFEGGRPGGWVVVVLGGAVTLACFWQFAWRGVGTPAPFDPPRHLVVSGPYRWLRNPMYVGFIIALVGEAIVFPNLTRPLLIEAAAFWMATALFVLLFEEPMLRRMFGAEYDDYTRHVRRWIPRRAPWYPPPHLE